MRACFICLSESASCGHREPEVQQAIYGANASAMLREVLRERYREDAKARKWGRTRGGAKNGLSGDNGEKA